MSILTLGSKKGRRKISNQRESKAFMTRSKRETIVENEGRINEEEELGAEKEKEKDKDQMEERKIKENEEEKKCKKER